MNVKQKKPIDFFLAMPYNSIRKVKGTKAHRKKGRIQDDGKESW